jgi:hypothetical protein
MYPNPRVDVSHMGLPICLRASHLSKWGSPTWRGVARADVHKITNKKVFACVQRVSRNDRAAYPAEPRDLHNYNVLFVGAAYGTVMICFFHGMFLMPSQRQTTPLGVMCSTARAYHLGNCIPFLMSSGCPYLHLDRVFSNCCVICEL